MDFVNEGKLDEERKRRQAEWERVRKPEDPIGVDLIYYDLSFEQHHWWLYLIIEAPAEVFDGRSLYDRLKEQHEIKKKEFEGTFALS